MLCNGVLVIRLCELDGLVYKEPNDTNTDNKYEDIFKHITVYLAFTVFYPVQKHQFKDNYQGNNN